MKSVEIDEVYELPPPGYCYQAGDVQSIHLKTLASVVTISPSMKAQLKSHVFSKGFD